SLVTPSHRLVKQDQDWGMSTSGEKILTLAHACVEGSAMALITKISANLVISPKPLS
nr:hypothetical protein [Tanacetum cinerariifolium]